MADEQVGVVLPFRHREREREQQGNPLIDDRPRGLTAETRRWHTSKGRCSCFDCCLDRYLTDPHYGRRGAEAGKHQ